MPERSRNDSFRTVTRLCLDTARIVPFQATFGHGERVAAAVSRPDSATEPSRTSLSGRLPSLRAGCGPRLVLKVLNLERFRAATPARRIDQNDIDKFMSQPASQLLLVEDDPQMPAMVTALLNGDNVALLHAANGTDALRLVRDRHVDIVLLDLGLPDISGFEVLRQLKEAPETQSIPVIVLTARNGSEDKLIGFEAGASDYLTKPFDGAELRARLRAVLRAKHLQDEVARANRELVAARVAAEAMARAKTDFLANMSHEIRTPMNGVTAMAGLLLETSLTHEQRGYVETIYSSSEALLGILNGILDFSKIESGKLELESRPFNLRLCVEEALDLFVAKAAEKQLDLAYQMDDGICSQVVGDVTRVRQVLINLIGNGIKFTERGEVVVQVKILSAPEPNAEASEPWYLHFSVRDTGIGIPVDRLARLFKSFSQADASTARQYGGTGLGLAISKRLVELMNGKMWVESVPNKGSTFHFTLPFRAAPPIVPSALSGPQPDLADLRLLIVDDNPTNCRILTLQATKWGMIPRSAQSAQVALEWLRTGETFDLAILDMQMPVMDGLMLAEEIRKLPGAARLPFILLASMGMPADHPDVVKAGFISCLTKPIKPAQLHEVLARAVSRTKHASCPPTAPSKLDPTLAARLPMRVLVCDDNIVNQKVAVRLVQQMGYRADVAANGLLALAALDRHPYDLILMDVMMPEMDGLEATRVIRERQRDRTNFPNYKSPTIIVAMTASAMQGDREKCLAAGMDDYMAKPVRPEDMRAMMERWGAAAGVSKSEDVPAKAAPPGPAPDAPAAAVPPVDMARLMDFTEGNQENLRELIELYLKQTGEQLEQLLAAIRASNAPEVRRLAHSCAGASATCGMARLVPLLRELERQGHEGQLTSAQKVCAEASQEFERIRLFLAPYQNGRADLAART